jgi:hypothetical protein
MTLILERDGPSCVWCAGPFDDHLNRATTEHLVPRIKGGPSWLENEVAACRRCNSQRGHRSLGEFAAECEALGREVDRDRIIRVLRSLQDAIARHGGQRRARPYIATQLRRLDV